MPARNRIKKYFPNSVYHIYNRGIDGRIIFADEEDYHKFLEVLEKYLTREDEEKDSIYKKERPYLKKKKEQMNLTDDAKMLALCLRPDHFHLLIWQKTEAAMTALMRRAITHYSMYYNRKYQRSGPVFENVYRAVGVEPGEKALLMTKYIHTSPESRQIKRFGLVETSAGFNPEYYLYSSYGSYLGNEVSGVNREMIDTARVIGWLKTSRWGKEGKTYRQFAQEPVADWNEVLGGLLLVR